MVFAHIPAGYLLAHVLVKQRRWPTWLLWVGMIGGTTPDLDILFAQYFNDQFLGHRISPMHFPIVWSLLAAICLILILLTKRKQWLPVWGVFFSTVFLHLFLDVLVGDVYLFAPFDWNTYRIISIPVTDGWWLMNHFRHWSFLIELGIIATAATVFFRGGYRDLFDLPKQK